LARILPTSILNKHKDNLFQIEALLYGQAGLLNPNLKDSYNLELLEEYRFLLPTQGCQIMDVEIYAHATGQFPHHTHSAICSVNCKIRTFAFQDIGN